MGRASRYSPEVRERAVRLGLDKVDEDWGYVVLARDQLFQFKPLDIVVDIESLVVACQQVQMRIAELLAEPQRIFPQSP